MSDSFVYLNGQIVPHDEAKISVFDIGLLRGLGIYEAMGAWNGTIFKFEEHMNRFRRSAQGIEISIPASDEEIKKIIFELLEKNYSNPPAGGFPRANIKFILTGGLTVGGISYDPSHPTFSIFTETWQPLDQTYYEHGARIITCEHVRHYAEYKTTDYITAVRLQKRMRAAGAVEALYTKDGLIFECTTSNVFIVLGGVLITPAENILHGITRNTVIEICRHAGIPVREQTVSLKEALFADECFITSSFKDILPVVAIDGQTIGDGLPAQVGTVGPITQKIMALFKDFAHL